MLGLAISGLMECPKLQQVLREKFEQALLGATVIPSRKLETIEKASTFFDCHVEPVETSQTCHSVGLRSLITRASRARAS